MLTVVRGGGGSGGFEAGTRDPGGAVATIMARIDASYGGALGSMSLKDLAEISDSKSGPNAENTPSDAKTRDVR